MINSDKFLQAKNLATAECSEGGIGTYSEKMLHRTLKFYFEPDSTNHEIEFQGSVADIKNDEGIVEIQTRSFNRLVPKLEKFLPLEKVRVVYPIIEHKTICRINEETGESLAPKRSPKKGSGLDALAEFSEIARFIPHENLSILVVFLDAVETRFLNGKVKVGRQKTAKIDAIPTALNSIVEFEDPKDFAKLLPTKIPAEFTSAQFERITHLHGIKLHNSLMFLIKMGILTREKRGGRAYIYMLNSELLSAM